jgi:hypothetical protein
MLQFYFEVLLNMLEFYFEVSTLKGRRRRPKRRWRRRPTRRRWRVKAPRMSGLGGSNPPRVVQDLFLLLIRYLLLNDLML